MVATVYVSCLNPSSHVSDSYEEDKLSLNNKSFKAHCILRKLEQNILASEMYKATII